MNTNPELNEYLENLLGPAYPSFLQSPAEPPAIRVNTLKASVAEITTLLEKHNYDFQPIPFSPNGFQISVDKLPLSHTLEFFEGRFQYQGISSQLPPIVLDVQPGERVLDMAASPGSKSTQLAAALQNRGILVLNDASSSRMQPLHVNMQRNGATHYYISKQRGETLSRIYPEYFDKILLDAPCSALGTLASKKEIKYWWSNEKLQRLALIQYQLLVSAIKCLRVGGEVVYATCSVAPEENEQVIQRILDKFPVRISTIPEKLKTGFEGGWQRYGENTFNPDMIKALRVWPHTHGLEGFFVIKLQKTGPVPLRTPLPPVDWRETLPPDDPEVQAALNNLSERWGIDPQLWTNYRYILTKSRLWMLGGEISRVPKFGFSSGGLLLGDLRRSGWKLSNASTQVLSTHINKNRIAVSSAELKQLFAEGKTNYADATGEYLILTYQDRALGTVYHENGVISLHRSHDFNLTL